MVCTANRAAGPCIVKLNRGLLAGEATPAHRSKEHSAQRTVRAIGIHRYNQCRAPISGAGRRAIIVGRHPLGRGANRVRKRKQENLRNETCFVNITPGPTAQELAPRFVSVVLGTVTASHLDVCFDFNAKSDRNRAGVFQVNALPTQAAVRNRTAPALLGKVVGRVGFSAVILLLSGPNPNSEVLF